MEKNPQIIFISHATAEKSVALALKSWIDEHHLGHLKAFASSSPESIPAGKKWFEEIKAALQKATLQIILCSQHSIKRPWINFEAGFAHARDIATIPLCYGGITTETLPMPLSHFQGINLTDSNACNDLFAAIAEHTGGQPPQVSYTDFYAELLVAVAHVKDIATISDRENKHQEFLEGKFRDILISLTQQHSIRQTNIVISKDRVLLEYTMDRLMDAGLIKCGDDGEHYGLTKEGRAFIFENKLILGQT